VNTLLANIIGVVWYPDFLQCFDTVGSATGRASSL